MTFGWIFFGVVAGTLTFLSWETLRAFRDAADFDLYDFVDEDDE